MDINSVSLIVASSGSKKLIMLMNLLEKMADSFEHIHVITNEKPLKDYLTVYNNSMYNNIDELPEFNDISSCGKQQLIIFDCEINNKEVSKRKKLMDYVICGRRKQFTQILIYDNSITIPEIIRGRISKIFLPFNYPDDKIKIILKYYKMRKEYLIEYL